MGVEEALGLFAVKQVYKIFTFANVQVGVTNNPREVEHMQTQSGLHTQHVNK